MVEVVDQEDKVLLEPVDPEVVVEVDLDLGVMEEQMQLLILVAEVELVFIVVAVVEQKLVGLVEKE